MTEVSGTSDGGTRARRALVRCSRLLVRAVSPNSYLREVCTAVTQKEGYLGAWIAVADAHDPLTMRVSARRGRFPDPCRPALAGGRLPRALRTILHSVSVDRKPAYLPIDGISFHTVLLPLLAEDKLLGMMLVTAGTPPHLDEAEHEILEQLGAEVSRGYHGLVNVQERVEVEERIYGQTEFAAAIVENAGTLIVVLDPFGRIVAFNRACELATGFREDEVRGLRVGEMFLPLDERYDPRADAIDPDPGAYPMRHESVWLTRAGMRRTISWTRTAMRDEAGRVEYVVACGIDITERRKAEAALRRRQTQLAALAEAGALALNAEGEIPYGQLLEILGRAVQATDAVLYENYRGPAGDLRGRLGVHWKARAGKGAGPSVDLSYSAGWFRRWAAVLVGGEIVSTAAAVLPPEEREACEAEGITTLALLPIFAGKRFAGVLRFAVHGAAADWQHADLELLKTGAAMLGQVMEREVVQRDGDMLRRLGRRLCGPVTVGDIGRIVGEECRKLLGHHAFSLCLMDSGSRSWSLPYREEVRVADRSVVSVINPAVGQFPNELHAVMVRMSPMIADLDGDQLSTSAGGGAGVYLAHTRCALLAPIIYRDAPLGILVIQSRVRGAFSEVDFPRVEAIAEHCAGAIHRARLDAELRHSRDVLARAEEIGNVGSFEHDFPLAEIYWSDSFYQMLGLRPRESPESVDLFVSLVHPDDRAKLQELIDRIGTDLTNYDYDLRIVRPSGEIRVLNMVGCINRDAAGVPLKSVGAAIDVTEQRISEQTALEAERLYREVIDASGGIPYRLLLATTYEQERYEFVGDGIEKLLGIPKYEITTERFKSLVTDITLLEAKGLKRGEDPWRAFVEGRVPRYEAEMHIMRPDGEERIVRDVTVPIRSPLSGQVLGALGILRDVTRTEAGAGLDAFDQW